MLESTTHDSGYEYDDRDEFDMRQRFESWMSDAGQYPRAIERSGDGYKLMAASTNWKTWQAAARVEREEAQILVSMSEDDREQANRLVRELRAALQTIYRENGEDERIASICSPLIDRTRDV